METNKKIKVIVVDDSSFIRNLFTDILGSDEEIEVVATASDPYDARDKIKQYLPDVITLDIEMPKMDGLEFLEKIMALRPMPVVMVSTLTQKGASHTLKALEIGAIDYIAKPQAEAMNNFLDSFKRELITKVKVAAKVKVKPREKHYLIKSDPIKFNENNSTKNKIIAIGASTGGVEAINRVLRRLPENIPPIVIVQHMPPGFTKSFASRLDSNLNLSVHEASDGQSLQSGNVYIAPGDRHIKVAYNNARYTIKHFDGEKVSGHKPSVDVLFHSIAQTCAKNAIGVILTGIGRDGAQGLLEMRNAGSYNIGQDEDSSTVYGMPKAAFQDGAVNIQAHIDKIAEEIIKNCV